MEFLCIYLGERRGRGCTNAGIYINGNTLSQPLLQNCLMAVIKLGRDEVLMACTCV